MTQNILRTRKPGEKIFALILLLLSIAAVHQSYSISGLSSISSPGILPLLASLVMFVSTVVFYRSLWAMAPPKAGVGFLSALTPIVLLVFGGLCGLYVFLLYLVGFLPSTFVFLLVSTMYLHRSGWLLAFFISINSIAVIYIVFRILFKIILPQGLLTL